MIMAHAEILKRVEELSRDGKRVLIVKGRMSGWSHAVKLNASLKREYLKKLGQLFKKETIEQTREFYRNQNSKSFFDSFNNSQDSANAR